MASSRTHRASADPPHTHNIELKLRDMSQLFNSMDPSPFIEKDLDDDAEEFIVSWAQEFPPGAPVKLRIHLEQWPAEDPTELIRQAVHNYFAHRAELTRLEFRRLMKQGRTSLLHRFGVPGRLPHGHQDAADRRRGHLGRRAAREPDDRRLGRDVAADADLSLRLVAAAAAGPHLYEVEPYAGGRGSTRSYRFDTNRSPAAPST